MNLIARQEEIDGKWFTWILLPDNNCLLIEEKLTEAEAEQKLLDWQSSQVVIPEVTDEPTN